ncbi:methanogenesis marker 2 protein [Methanogenium organophilum]|uniref:Methanogenesis marker 2 protein n=1 Tax=Methanogenium organophilum TaxID=2199 RepID=A0A9X9S5K3_METOG|nr:methanogenesis marker 2 protein [Methanogenium organophilum]WAI01858.1 methanogenesis marker 2 protein [Methanogenium organophilum]
MVECSTDEIADAIRAYDGVTRKRAIGEIIESLRLVTPNVPVSFGDDAALIQNGDSGLLLAADGIWSRLLDADPYWAGFCAVLVNVHDIAAMGGTPLAIVDILSVKDSDVCHEVLRGMYEASAKFCVPVVGGHLHPDAEMNVIDVAILGSVNPEYAIFSHTAGEGDRIVAAIDLEGRIHPSCALNWDSATLRTAEEVRAQIRVMHTLGTDKLVSAGKDISNPGVIGTLGMLLETSRKGASVCLDDIPRPDLDAIGITFDHWVRMYPGMGFVVTVPAESVDRVLELFSGVGMAAADIGVVTDSQKLIIRHGDAETTVFDLKKQGIMGIPTDN